MSAQLKASNDVNTDANAEVTQDNQVVNEPAANAAVDVNKRLLEESKHWKSKAQEYKKQIEDAQKQKAAEQGEFKELYEKTKAQHDDLYKKFVGEKVKMSVSQVASKHGCVDVEALMRLGNVDLLRFDPETAEVHGADIFVEEAKKNKSYLFQLKQSVATSPMTPGGANGIAAPKVYKDLSADERRKLLTKGLDTLRK